MAWLGSLVLAVVGLVVWAWLLQREKAERRRQRHGILEDCLRFADAGEIVWDEAGFPCLRGTIAGRAIQADLLPDTLTLRRLPQLWLSLTILTPLPAGATFGVLVRPSGNEFYARTPDLPSRLDAPAGFPAEALVRGWDPRAAAALAKASRPLASLLADPRVKEVIATPRGLRVIHQAAEGRRGQHLLLRQCDFGEAKVEAATFLQLYDGLDAVVAALQPQTRGAPVKPGSQPSPPIPMAD